MGEASGLDKRAWRETMSKRVASVAPEHARAAAERAAEEFLDLPEIAAASRVLVCLSFGAEISTQPVIAELERSGRELYVPRAEPRDGMLHLHRYPCELVTLGFGLRQPPRECPELDPAEVDRTLDAALVLGLAFDESGIRLGHGRGYFDRFLAGRGFPAIGFAYEVQVVERLPREPHDVPMTALVTEASTRRFAPAGRAPG
jgi:5-formyltetrahydrofolate cyclo-ligase